MQPFTLPRRLYVDVVAEVSFQRVMETLLPRISVLGVIGTMCESLCLSRGHLLADTSLHADHITGFMVRKAWALALVFICLGLCSLGLGLTVSEAICGHDLETLYW